MLIAQFNTQGVIAVLMLAFSLRAAGFFFPYLFGHYWSKANGKAALISMVSGLFTVFLVHYHIVPALFSMEPIISALAVSLLTFVIFCILPKKVTRT
jgi:solute:Na+ symporter, SSS family